MHATYVATDALLRPPRIADAPLLKIASPIHPVRSPSVPLTSHSTALTGMDGPTAGKLPNGEVSTGSRPVDIEEDTLPGLLRSFLDGVFGSPAGAGGGDESLLRRLRAASCEAAPRLREASRNSARDLLEWTRRGSGLRAILVISVGTITLIALTGLLIFMSFLLVATANAIVVSVLISLAAAGGFLALFFACLVAVYVGAVSIATFAISATVISAIVGVLIATGWLGFFWMIWFAARKSMELTKHSIGMTSSAIHSYSASRHGSQKKPVN